MMKPFFSLLALIVCCINAIAQPTSEWGCTDPAAPNYNSAALYDDGSCCYDGTWVVITASADGYFSFGNNQIGFLGAVSYPSQTGFCLPDVCAYVNVQNYSGIGTFTWSIADLQGNVLASGAAVDNYYDFAYLQGGPSIPGCTDAFACNYNPEANCADNGTCDYSCYGCTDPESYNYDADATVDDGTCCNASNFLTLVCPESPDFYIYVNVFSNSGIGTSLGNGSTFCAQDGCYEMSAYVLGLENPVDTLFYSLVNANGETVAEGFVDPLNYTPQGFSIDAVAGCTDPTACNYNPEANCGNYTLCTYNCYGCTDPTALNYDPAALYDDGSCCSSGLTLTANGNFVYEVFNYDYSSYTSNFYPQDNFICVDQGCYTVQFYNMMNDQGVYEPVDWQISDADGNVLYSGTTEYWGGSAVISINSISGCTDANACNFNPEANCSDNSLCDYSCVGCTDPAAPNYNPSATIDNGTCCYNTWYTITSNYPGWWSVASGDGANYYSGHYPESNGFCMPEVCYNLAFYTDDYSVTDVTASISNGSETIATAGFDPVTGSVSFLIENGGISGCLDIYACNYNPEATCPDYSSCTYDCYGCTDPSAPNYNAEATIDNGSCCYNDWFTLELSGPAYWTVWSENTYSWGIYPEENGFCADTSSCFNFSLWSMDGGSVDYSLINLAGETVQQGTYAYTDYGVLVNLASNEEGCLDPAACNYNPNASCGLYYLCDYSCYGCTNPEAANYDETATLDDGTCCTDTWLEVSMSGPAYWYTISNGTYAGGSYPEQTGFCMPASCFSFYVYSIDGNPVVYTISDADGNLVYSGNAEAYSYIPVSVSLSGEISGCTDPSACNYNADATCDDGGCLYYCGGCTDEQALNYNALALFDDGTCFYNQLPPLMGMTMMPDEENDQFYVVLNMMDEGNGAPYLMLNSYNNQTMMMNEAGQYIAGPYPCDEEINFSLQSMSASMMVYMDASLQGACAIISSVEEEAMNARLGLYPNPGQGLFTIQGVHGSRCEVRVYDITGHLVSTSFENSGSGNIQIDLSSLENGIYQIQVTDTKGSDTVRAILQK